MKYIIKIINKKRLIEWLRFIQDSRPKDRIKHNDIYVFDFVNADFLQPYHLTSLACLIEDYKINGAKIKFKLHKKTQAGVFLMYTKFDKYWNTGFDRNYCLNIQTYNTIPIWKYNDEKIDSYANLIMNFYSEHSVKGKDLTPLRLTIVEALNNIKDHSESKIGGFIFTQFFFTSSELDISICDFGVGIPKKVNSYLAKLGERKRCSDLVAIERALELGFSTKSQPHNAGRGLDTILSNVNTSKGEIQIISNKAFYFKSLKNSKVQIDKDNLSLNFRGTYLNIKLNTLNFLDAQEELDSEMSIF